MREGGQASLHGLLGGLAVTGPEDPGRQVDQGSCVTALALWVRPNAGLEQEARSFAQWTRQRDAICAARPTSGDDPRVPVRPSACLQSQSPLRGTAASRSPKGSVSAPVYSSTPPLKRSPSLSRR